MRPAKKLKDKTVPGEENEITDFFWALVLLRDMLLSGSGSSQKQLSVLRERSPLSTDVMRGLMHRKRFIISFSAFVAFTSGQHAE